MVHESVDKIATAAQSAPKNRARLAILICSEFASDNAGSYRQERWARHYLGVCDGIIVHFPMGWMRTVERRFDSVAALNEFREHVRKTVPPRRTSRSGAFARVLRAIKYFLLAEFFVPRNYALIAKLAARLLSEPGVTTIHVSSPPFPFAFFTAVVSKMVKRRAKLHIDMRDPWATHHTLGGFRPLKALIERRALRAADVVTTATRFMADEIHEYHGVIARPVYNIATHVAVRQNESPSELKSATSASRRIVYAGTMPEGFYDIARLAEWLIAASHSELSNKYEWVFIGECGPLEAALRARKGESGNVQFSGRVSHEKAVEAMGAADALLFLGHRFPGYLTTKLFEYISLARPILPLFLDSSSEAYTVIRQLCGECPAINTFDDLQRALTEFEELPRLRNREALDELGRDYSTIARNVMNAGQAQVGA